MPVVMPLKSPFYAKFHLKHEKRDVRGFSSACVSMSILSVCVCLGCFGPCWGLTSNSWCLRQEIQVCGLCSTLHVRAGCALLLPRHSPHPVSFLLSVSIVTSLQASGMQSAFEFKEMWFLSSDSSKPSPVCVCTCAEHGHLRATHVGCLCLLCSRLDPPIPQEATGRWRALD